MRSRASSLPFRYPPPVASRNLSLSQRTLGPFGIPGLAPSARQHLSPGYRVCPTSTASLPCHSGLSLCLRAPWPGGIDTPCVLNSRRCSTPCCYEVDCWVGLEVLLAVHSC